MDSSASPAQNAQDKITSDQPNTRAQPPVTSPPSSQPMPAQPPVPQNPQSGSTNKESGPVATASESTENDEEEIKIAPQEAPTQVSQPSSETESDAGTIEVHPAIPEAKVEKSVENIIEKSPDQEKPALPQVVKDAGVTHSGPGMITVEENTFGVATLPKTYAQAVAEEKQTKIKDSKHWLVATVMYVWRKLNPKLGKKGVTA